jgi:hypothetical protein
MNSSSGLPLSQAKVRSIDFSISIRYSHIILTTGRKQDSLSQIRVERGDHVYHATSTHQLMFIKGTSINLWTEGTYEPHEIAQINKTKKKKLWVMGTKLYGRRTKIAMRRAM